MTSHQKNHFVCVATDDKNTLECTSIEQKEYAQIVSKKTRTDRVKSARKSDAAKKKISSKELSWKELSRKTPSNKKSSRAKVVTRGTIRTNGTSEAGIVPQTFEGNDSPGCTLCDGTSGQWARYEATKGSFNQSFYFGDEKVDIVSDDGVNLGWFSSGKGITSIIVKGGDSYNQYVYDGSIVGDNLLLSPLNSSGTPAAISHVSVCFDPRIALLDQVTGSGSATGTQPIAVNLTVQSYSFEQASYTVQTGQSLELVASGTWAAILSPTDVYPISGSVQLSGPTGLDFEIDRVYYGSGVSGSNFTYQDGVLNFNAFILLGSVPSFEINIVISAGCATRTVTFSVPLTIIPNYDLQQWIISTECGTQIIDVAQVQSGTVSCSQVIDPQSECGTLTRASTVQWYPEGNETNVGTLTTTANITVTGCVEDGCTLTQGYWRTHSSYGPAAKPNDLWLQLEQGPDTVFYLSEKSYYDVLWVNPRGNAYYILAKQFIAAKLNSLGGASLSSIQADYDWAEQFFQAATPDSYGGRASVIEAAEKLTSYNEGTLPGGPSHCDGQ